jgi:Beta-lactamase
VTVGDLLAFHRALVGGRLLGPELTAAALTPHEVHSRRSGFTDMMGYGFEFRVAEDGRVRFYQKDGVNVGASAILRHYPDHDLTLSMLGVGEDAIWAPVRVLDDAVPRL